MFRHLLLEFRRISLVVLVEVAAGFGGDGETCRHRQPDLGHLRQARSLSAEQVAPRAVALRFTCAKKIDPFRHCILAFRFNLIRLRSLERCRGADSFSPATTYFK